MIEIYEVTHHLPYVCPNCEGRLTVVGTATNERNNPVIGLYCPRCDRAMEIEIVLDGRRNPHAEGYAQYELYLDVTNPYRDEWHAQRFHQGVEDAKKDEIPF